MQLSPDKEWDQVWIGANIATMVAGAQPYGNLKNAALAVKGERIAWIGPAADARRKAELYAQAAGSKLGKVLYITESGGTFQSPLPSLQGAAMAVPIAVGDEESRVSVTVTYALE